jgi:hypothetical protein
LTGCSGVDWRRIGIGRCPPLVERLAEERHRLDQLAHAGLAVRSSLDFSYRLDPADRMLLCRASLLDAPDFAAWTAGAVADETVPVVEEGLDGLVAAHLVQIAGTDGLGAGALPLA